MKIKNKIILVTEPQEISSVALKLLEKNMHEIIINADGIDKAFIQGLFIRSYTKVSSDYLHQYPNLKYILRAGVGLDNIDLEECNRRSITVFNSPGSNSQAVAEYVVGMMLYKLRNIQTQSKCLYNNLWRDRRSIGSQLTGKTIGLVGCGSIGRSIVKLLFPFNVKIIGYDPYIHQKKLDKSHIKKVTFQDLLKQSDIISIQVPLTAETIGLFGKDQFNMMKSDAILINISRGDLLIEEDLISALNHNMIGGAVLDVFKDEPNINPRFHSTRNLYITPHIAGYTKESDVEMSLDVVKNYLNYINNN